MELIVGNVRKKWRRHWWQIIWAIGLLMLLVLPGSTQRSPAHAQSVDWPMYLMNNERTGFNSAETALNPQTAPNLRLLWTHRADGGISSQPVEANGLIYWGSWDGFEHASRPADGTDVWSSYLGKVTIKGHCLPPSAGVASTATVTSIMIKGTITPVAFVGGGDAHFYALDANTGATIWQYSFGSPPGYMIWDSPIVFNKSVYIGVSSYGDCPLTPGLLVKLNAATGSVQASFNVVPNGCLGGGIWGSPAIDTMTNMIYFATGTKRACSPYEYNATALVELNATDLSFVASWQVPASESIADGDFGSTPTLFQATISGVIHKMVGLANKNGIYYAFDRDSIGAGILWKVRLAVPPTRTPPNHQPSISSSSWDGSTLYAAGAITKISRTRCPGSLRGLNPANGKFLWQVCLTGNVFGPVISVPGLVVVGAGQFISVIDAATGNRLFEFQDTDSNSAFWGPASISNGVLYQGNMDGNLYAFGL